MKSKIIAEEILTLINAQPRTPTLEEIKAVVEKAGKEVDEFRQVANDALKGYGHADPPMIAVSEKIRDVYPIYPGGITILPEDPEAKLLTYTEFKDNAAENWRNFLDWEKQEGRLDEVVIFLAHPLVAFSDKAVDRLANGRMVDRVKLASPNRLYVIHWNEEMDCTQLVPIDWRVAETILPHHKRAIGDMLWSFRREQQAKQYGVADDDPRLVKALAENTPSKRIADAS